MNIANVCLINFMYETMPPPIFRIFNYFELEFSIFEAQDAHVHTRQPLLSNKKMQTGLE